MSTRLRRKRSRGGLVLALALVALGAWLVGTRLGIHPLAAGARAPHTRPAVALQRAAAAQVGVVGALGSGTGVLLDASGDVLAGAWMLGTRPDATLRLADGTQRPARVRGIDARTGLALLVADAPLGAADMLDAVERLQAGQQVYALGVGGAARAVSGVLRTTPSALPGQLSVPQVASDAVVCPQDAGGVLADTAGRVVGVLLARTGCGPARALPLAAAHHLAAELKSAGRATRGWIGLAGGDTPDGVRVLRVAAGSPAAQAGIRPGDRVLNLDGLPVRHAAELDPRVAESPPGHDAALTLVRDGHTLGVTVIVAAEPLP